MNDRIEQLKQQYTKWNEACDLLHSCPDEYQEVLLDNLTRQRKRMADLVKHAVDSALADLRSDIDHDADILKAVYQLLIGE